MVNVGWLSGSRPFPTGVPPAGLVEALLACCLRPVEPSRGYHVCELCSDASAQMMICEHGGRRVALGNGEVRVTGADGRIYAAPTLVAHYVAAHAYLPPEPFVTAVMVHAAALVPVPDAELPHEPPFAARLSFCLGLLEQLETHTDAAQLVTQLFGDAPLDEQTAPLVELAREAGLTDRERT